MGDRGNFKLIFDEKNIIYFYTHWKGFLLEEILKEAMKSARLPSEDPSYFSSALFRVLTADHKGSEYLNLETGYGISTSIEDNNYDLIVIDIKNDTFWSETEEGKRTSEVRNLKDLIN